jgi:hypothetical protein
MNLHVSIVASIVAVLSWFSVTPSAQAAGLCQGIAVPAYFYPGSLWTAAIGAAPRTTLMIMNPNSGPSTIKDANYASAVAKAQAAGVKVLGYVATNYGNRPVVDVKNEINAYKSWYGVDGIFLDEVHYDAAYLPYYKTLATYIRAAKGGFVMLNPGMVPAEGYVKLADTTVVFEDSYADYVGWVPPSWMYKYPAGKLTHLVYKAADATQLTNAINLSRSRNAGMIYITNDVLNNPWDTLPTYWTSEVNTMTAKCAL